MRSRSRWVLKAGKLRAHIVEEDVVEEIMTRLWWQYRIKVYRVRERIPKCPKCHAFVGRPSESGIPDLIGVIPPGMLKIMEDEDGRTSK